MKKASLKTTTALGLMAMLAGEGLKLPDHSRRDSNRMKLMPEELKKLSSLSGKAKKKFVLELKGKYSKCQSVISAKKNP